MASPQHLLSPALTPDQARFVLQLGLPIYRAEHRTTRRVIEAIPADKGDYRPEAASRTALELAWHIVASEKRFLRAIAEGVFDFTAVPRPESITDAAGIAAWSGTAVAEGLERLDGIDGEALNKVIDFRGLFQLPAVSFLQVSLSHSVHHRGQLSTYLRPMGAKVPSIYGESYDAAQARLAKEGKV